MGWRSMHCVGWEQMWDEVDGMEVEPAAADLEEIEVAGVQVEVRLAAAGLEKIMVAVVDILMFWLASKSGVVVFVDES